MTTMTSPSVDFIRKDNAYKAALKEVQEKLDRSRDVETREFSEDLFKSLYPDYGEPSDYLAKRKGEIAELKAVADRARATHESIVGFDHMADEDRKGVRPAPGLALATDSIGVEMMRTDAWRAFKSRSQPVMTHKSDMSLKALFETTAGWDPESTRSGVVVELPQRRPGLIDIVPSLTTTQDTYKFMRETTNTSGVAEITEGAVYPESTFEYTEASRVMVQMGGFVPVTDIVLEDEPSVRGRIEAGIVGQIRRRLESQMWLGAGTGANNVIMGYSTITDRETVDASAMNFFEAITTAQDEVWKDGEADANYAVVNSSDWTKWLQSQESTGGFIVATDTAVDPRRAILDIPVIRSNVIPAGQALVGDFNYSMLVDRRDVSIEMERAQNAPTTGGATAPTGRFNLYGSIRAALVVLRGPAFCHISNITF